MLARASLAAPRAPAPAAAVARRSPLLARAARLAWFVRRLAADGLADALLLCAGAPCAYDADARATLAWLLTDAVGLEPWALGFAGECALLDDCCALLLPSLALTLVAPRRSAARLAPGLAAWPGARLVAVPDDDDAELCGALAGVLEGLGLGGATLALCASKTAARTWPLVGALDATVRRLVDVRAAVRRLVHARLDGPGLAHLAGRNATTESFARTFAGLALGLVHAFAAAPSLAGLAERVRAQAYDAAVYFRHARATLPTPPPETEPPDRRPLADTPGTVALREAPGGCGVYRARLASGLVPLYVERSCVVAGPGGGGLAGTLGAALGVCRHALHAVAREARFGEAPSAEELRARVLALPGVETLGLDPAGLRVRCEHTDTLFAPAERVAGVLCIRLAYRDPASGLRVVDGDTWALCGGALCPLTAGLRLAPGLRLPGANAVFADDFSVATLDLPLAPGLVAADGRAFRAGFDLAGGVDALASLQRSPGVQGVRVRVSTGAVAEVPLSAVRRVAGEGGALFLGGAGDEATAGWLRALLALSCPAVDQAGLETGCFVRAERRSSLGRRLAETLAAAEHANRLAGTGCAPLLDVAVLGEPLPPPTPGQTALLDADALQPLLAPTGPSPPTDTPPETLVLTALADDQALVAALAGPLAARLMGGAVPPVLAVVRDGAPLPALAPDAPALLVLLGVRDAAGVLARLQAQGRRPLQLVAAGCPPHTGVPRPVLAPPGEARAPPPVVSGRCCQSGPALALLLVPDGASHREAEAALGGLLGAAPLVVSAPPPRALLPGFALQPLPDLGGLVADLAWPPAPAPLLAVPAPPEPPGCFTAVALPPGRVRGVPGSRRVAAALELPQARQVLGALRTALDGLAPHAPRLVLALPARRRTAVVLEASPRGLTVADAPAWLARGLVSGLHTAPGATPPPTLGALVQALCGLLLPARAASTPAPRSPPAAGESDEALWRRIAPRFADTPLPPGWLTDGQRFLSYDGERLFVRPDWRLLVAAFRKELGEGKGE